MLAASHRGGIEFNVLTRYGRCRRRCRYWRNHADFRLLLWVVAPILLPAEIETPTDYRIVERSTALVDVGENGEAMVRISETGIVEFSLWQMVRIAAFDLGRTIVKQNATAGRHLCPIRRQQQSAVKTDYIIDFDNVSGACHQN